MMQLEDLDRALLDHSQQVRQHYQTPQVAVRIPLTQAFVTGVLYAVPSTFGTGMAAYFLNAGPVNAFVLAVFAGFSVCCIVTLRAWNDNRNFWRGLIENLETRFDMDINRDGVTGPETARIEVSFRDTGIMQTVELPVPMWKAVWLAREILEGRRKFTERDLSGSNNPFSLDEVDEMRAVFMARGWMRWANADEPRQGVEWTAKGTAVLKGLAEIAPSEDLPPRPGGVQSAKVYAFRTHAIRTQDFRGNNHANH